MSAPLRGTQSLVGQMGWVFARPWLALIEVAWRWFFGIPFLAVCWMQAQRVLHVLPLESSGLAGIDLQNPWVAATQITDGCARYAPLVVPVLVWLVPVSAIAWAVVSGLARGLLLRRMNPRLGFRPLALIGLQGAWVVLFLGTMCAWLRCMQWVAATHIMPNAEPDLVSFSGWTIFLALGFFTLWALISWPLLIAPLLMLQEERSVLSALGESLRLGKVFNGKLVEINLVMGIVNLALIVVAMVLSAAPLPFSDQLGPDAMRVIGAVAVVFYLVASDYFQVVQLKGFLEFWGMYRGGELVS